MYHGENCIMKQITNILIAGIFLFNFIQDLNAQGKNVLTVSGVSFELNGIPFEYTGVSFFNALYNPEFNRSSDIRKEWIRKFMDHGINVLRIWCQYDNGRGFVDGGPDRTLYLSDGSLKPEFISRLKDLIRDADDEGTIILLVLFSRESWEENIRLGDRESEHAVEMITRELIPFRNLVFQIWNEHDHRTLDYLNIIKRIDPARLVTNSPGYGGHLGSLEENRKLDYLSPHTTREDTRHWEIAAKEIEYLLNKYRKPVVDDEPARTGTSSFGGPKNRTLPEDHIIHIYNIWKAGGYAIYHHDMFQTGYNSPAVPPNGIPAPGFSAYHDRVFEFLQVKERFLRNLR